ncbi:MAG: rhombosortase [Gammaproteobacteria bacterium]|nr:rhombosortase [Gammaproteobacteria bacterium]
MGLRKVDNSTKTQSSGTGWKLPLAASLLAGGLMLTAGTGQHWLQFDRGGVADGELWRLVSAHFVHLGWSHLLLNVAGLGLVWYLVGDTFRQGAWLLIAAASVVFIDLGLWFLNPQLIWYVGMSGLLHGLLAAGLTQKLREPDWESVLLALGLFAKLAWEQAMGPMPGSESTAGGPVIVNAHLFGALGGIFGAICVRIVRYRAQPGK